MRKRKTETYVQNRMKQSAAKMTMPTTTQRPHEWKLLVQ